MLCKLDALASSSTMWSHCKSVLQKWDMSQFFCIEYLLTRARGLEGYVCSAGLLFLENEGEVAMGDTACS